MSYLHEPVCPPREAHYYSEAHMLVAVDDVKNQFFDYVIVGGGTAGLTLAARLTEDLDIDVLVIEAGQANLDDPALLRPASFGSHLGNPLYAWGHKTTKQQHANEREADWSRGKGLGGSSSVNFMCYTKPPSRDIDDFEKLGNPGWNWANYEKALERAEGFCEPSEEFRRHKKLDLENWKIGRQGPLKISFPGIIDDGELSVQQAFINSGLPRAELPISGKPKGSFFIPNTYDPKLHKRSYATTAFYQPNKERPNYKVLVNAYAQRVLTEKAGNGDLQAVDVEFEVDGKIHTVNARKEVVLAAGSLKTPQLLELSGIGRQDVLEKIRVPLKIELPGVGENVQEHYFVGSSWELRDDAPYDTLDLLRDPAVAAKHLELHESGQGLHTTGIVGFAFASLDMIMSEERHAEIYNKAKDALAKVDAKANPGLVKQYELTLERMELGKCGSPGCEFISFPGLLSGPNLPEPGKRYATIIAAVNHCLSRGTIHSVSNDANKDPEYDAHYLEQDVDMDVHLEMIKHARKIAVTSPLKEMIAKELNPGSEVQTDEQLKEWIKNTFNTTWHTAGSCSMMPKDKNGVVDPTLKVYGTNNLRVVDLSIVPLHFAAHPQATVYAIAELAADILKGKTLA